jgi:ribokinase
MGSFVADLTFRAPRLPAWGHTVLGGDFRLGPGGKGSNQAVAAARLGARGAVCFIGRLGTDAFGELARRTYDAEGIDARFCTADPDHPTGAASVILHQASGENAIVVDPGSGMHLSLADVERAAGRIAESAVFVTQCELALDVAELGLRLARAAGVTTILNPAPAIVLPERIYALCDYLTPNESEAATLTGLPVADVADAVRAAQVLRGRGAANVVVTLGARGAVVKTAEVERHLPAFAAGPVVETTGAGDAFNGALAVALAAGLDVVAATRFASAAAGIAVTRPGTALAMPTRAAVDALLGRSG